MAGCLTPMSAAGCASARPSTLAPGTCPRPVPPFLFLAVISYRVVSPTQSGYIGHQNGVADYCGYLPPQFGGVNTHDLGPDGQRGSRMSGLPVCAALGARRNRSAVGRRRPRRPLTQTLPVSKAAASCPRPSGRFPAAGQFSQVTAGLRPDAERRGKRGLIAGGRFTGTIDIRY